ncbi:MAG TPA: efflux RND transporter periplasmic adaptor subunit, partial [Cyclobacteriaceae bacterium]|nr:efflux RND transporter periplasmic adaptor subunit [Cyclobacteriaceae bacterium]
MSLSGCSRKKNQVDHVKYTCPMHPEIVRDKPGACPICFMDLVKVGDAGIDNSIMLNEIQIKLANISVAPVSKKEMTLETRFNGRLAVNENETEVIGSRVQGRVERLFFKETGRRVARGEPLYRIYSEELLTLQQEYLLALRQTEELKEKRFEPFLKASERKLLRLGMTGGQILSLGKQQQANSRITFFAPASGVITAVNAAEGQYVSEGAVLYRLEKLDRLWVEAELYPGEISLIRVGDRVKVEVNGFENDSLHGTVIFLNPEYRQGNQIITLRIEMNNPDGKFMPGMQASVITTHPGKNTLVLPLDAVIRDQSASHVWIQ